VNTDIAKDEAQMQVGKTVKLKIRGDERDYKVVGVVSGQLMVRSSSSTGSTWTAWLRRAAA